MQIREEQLGALAQAQRSRFSVRMLVHIREFFPSVFASLGEEKLLLLVRHGIERGKHYGITSERDVCKLIDLMLILGQDMDRKFPRIAATLDDTATPSNKRVDAVFDALLASLKKRADAPSPDASRLALDGARADADTNFATTPVDETTTKCPLEKSLKGEVVEVEWGSGIPVSIAPPYADPRNKLPQQSVLVPHWKTGISVVEAAGSKRPAVFLVKGKGSDAVTVKVKITENKNVSGSSTLLGNFAGLLIEGTCPTGVGEHAVSAKIKNLPDSIQWYRGEAAWGLHVPSLGSSVSLANSSRLEVFVVLDTPSSFYNPPGVWAEVLRFLCQKVGITGLRTPADVNARVTSYCHGSHGLRYDTRRGAAHYGVYNDGGDFKLARYIGAASKAVNCYDQAAAVQSLCGAVGVRTMWYFLQPFGYIKTTNLVGVGACNNPFFESNGTTPVVATDDPLRTAFGNHSFCGFTGLILDACAGPHTGNEDKTQYCATSIDANPELYSEGDRPGNASKITTLGGVTSLE